jgi:hypothetical protein
MAIPRAFSLGARATTFAAAASVSYVSMRSTIFAGRARAKASNAAVSLSND